MTLGSIHALNQVKMDAIMTIELWYPHNDTCIVDIYNFYREFAHLPVFPIVSCLFTTLVDIVIYLEVSCNVLVLCYILNMISFFL